MSNNGTPGKLKNKPAFKQRTKSVIYRKAKLIPLKCINFENMTFNWRV
jgi:hypothetical protein